MYMTGRKGCKEKDSVFYQTVAKIDIEDALVPSINLYTINDFFFKLFNHFLHIIAH